MLNEQPIVVRWEHFQHDANIGIRGILVRGPSMRDKPEHHRTRTRRE